MKPGRISLAAFVALGLLSVPVQAETIQVIVDKLVFAPVDVNAKVGDTVRIEETRPLSKLKRWRLVEVLEKGSGVAPVAV